VIALTVEADDEHGASVALADGLVWGEDRPVSALRCAVADAFSEGAMAELVGATKEFNGKVGGVGSDYRLHGAVMLVAKRKEVRPHAMRV